MLPSLLLATLLLLPTIARSEEPPPAPTEAPPAEPVRVAAGERSEQLGRALAQRFPRQALELQAGEETFVGLQLPSNLGQSRGVIVLLPGDGESADWPRVVGPLRRQLPDVGWQTLSLTLPDAAPALPAAEPAAPTPDAGTAPEADAAPADGAPSEAGYLPEKTAPPLDDAQPPQATAAEPKAEPVNQAQRIEARLEAALTQARSSGAATVVLVGHGTGAYWAARYLQNSGAKDVGGLVLIEPRRPAEQDKPLADLLSELALPTADFIYGQTGTRSPQARERLDASQRARHPNYRQIILQRLPADAAAEQEQLYRRVRAWLDKQTTP